MKPDADACKNPAFSKIGGELQGVTEAWATRHARRSRVLCGLQEAGLHLPAPGPLLAQPDHGGLTNARRVGCLLRKRNRQRYLKLPR